jgi:hypothetical protein
MSVKDLSSIGMSLIFSFPKGEGIPGGRRVMVPTIDCCTSCRDRPNACRPFPAKYQVFTAWFPNWSRYPREGNGGITMLHAPA